MAGDHPSVALLEIISKKGVPLDVVLKDELVAMTIAADRISRESRMTMANQTNDLLPTRWSLLSRLKNWDDQESWQEFFDTYWRLIYSVAVKAGLSDVEAQDVVQETVITVAKKLEQFKTDPAHGSFKGWLL